jgi:molybdate transport system substrate-binding protein
MRFGASFGIVLRLLPFALVAATTVIGGRALSQDDDALRVYSSNGVRSVLQGMQPEIERAIGRRLAFQFSTSRDLTDRISADEAFDVAVLTPSLIDDLIAVRKVVPDSRNEFARVGVGVGSRAGAPVKSVGTLNELRQTLLEAETIAFGQSGQSRRTNEASFEALGIADDMRAKTRLTGPGEAPILVANGDIELVLTLVSELLREPGVQFLGPLPPDVQGYVDFAAGVSANTPDAGSAEAFVEFLSTPAFIAELERNGLEPIDP